MQQLLGRLQAWTDRPRPAAANVAAIAGAVAVVAALRWAIDRGVYGFNFSPFLPIILISAVLLGWRYAALCAVLSILTVTQLFMEPDWFDRAWHVRLSMLGLFAVIVAIIVMVSEALRRLQADVAARAKQVETYNDELQHRTSNLVQVLVNWIERGMLEDDPREYFGQLSAHLIAWSRSKELLRSSVSPVFEMSQLAALALSPFADPRIACGGPPARVEGEAARAAAMAIHELATNSAKYGALSGITSGVRLTWRLEPGRVRICWSEDPADGAAAPSPQFGSGFGLKLLAAMQEIDELALTRDHGVTCEFTVRRQG